MRLLNALAFCAIIFCGQSIAETMRVTYDVAGIRLGMSREQVFATLGEPSATSASLSSLGHNQGDEFLFVSKAGSEIKVLVVDGIVEGIRSRRLRVELQEIVSGSDLIAVSESLKLLAPNVSERRGKDFWTWDFGDFAVLVSVSDRGGKVGEIFLGPGEAVQEYRLRQLQKSIDP